MEAKTAILKKDVTFVKSKIRFFVLSVLIFFALLSPATVVATDFYVGVTFVVEGSSKVCSLMRFKTSGFSLSEADALYALLTNYMTQSNSIDGQSHILPSKNLADGVTGESLVNTFLQSGTGVCLINGKPVDQVFLESLYPCDYQGAKHMCIRLYVHTGALDLSAYGVPSNMVAGLGAIVVAEPIWDAATSQILANPPKIPLAISNVARQMKDAVKSVKREKALRKSK